MASYDPDALELRLAQLSPLALTAVAAACAERVNPVYEKYWVGDHVREVREAIDYAWECCAGAAPDPVRAQHLEDFVRDQVEFLNEEGITILASSATVSLRVLETLNPKADQKLGAQRACGSSLYVAQMAADLSGTVNEETAEDEEVTWQDRAINLVRTGQGPWTPQLFRELGPDPPNWWRAYDAGPEHLI